MDKTRQNGVDLDFFFIFEPMNLPCPDLKLLENVLEDSLGMFEACEVRKRRCISLIDILMHHLQVECEI